MSEKPTYEELERRVEELEKEGVRRKFAEEKLRESEDQYTALAEHVADGISLIQDGKIIYANDAFAITYDYADSSQVIGLDAVDLFCTEYKQPFLDIYESLISGLAHEKKFQAKCISGKGYEFWVEEHYNVIHWKDKLTVLATARDITRAKVQEIAIKEEAERLRKDNIKLRVTLKDRYKFGDIIGKSQPMQEIYNLILEAASTDSSVVLYGESGTGKELIARTIHDMSDRREKAFTPVNCGAVPESIFENEFFGHRKGAYTGADSDKPGFFDQANGGTLFLDEIGELTLNMQVKLLRAIEGGGYTPVGGNKVRYSDVRIIVATNDNLTKLMKTGKMREDFFYRVQIVPIHVPPLKERKEDIPLLIDHFLTLYGDGKKIFEIPGDIMEILRNYSWPGNVRELQNVLQRYITIKHLDLMSESEQMNIEDMPSRFGFHHQDGDSAHSPEYGREYSDLRSSLRDFEKSLILQALDQAHWNRNKSAKMLNIPLRTLSRKMRALKLI
jgi:PAS domain S-box-containing protein